MKKNNKKNNIKQKKNKKVEKENKSKKQIKNQGQENGMCSNNSSSSKESLEALRHSAEHVLHLAAETLYPGLKKVMGPPIKNGFYFDFDYKEKITPDDFKEIESKMQEIIDSNLEIKMREASEKEVGEIFKNNKYKLGTMQKIKDRKEKITVCEMGSSKDKFYDIDLCRGPHIKNTNKIKAFKLLNVSGAYYEGDENNKMLQRIYATAFPSQKQLDKFLENRKEAKKRDHRKLGKELDLFCFSNLVGPGLPLFTPKGTTIIKELRNHIEKVNKKYGFKEVITPHVAKIDLFKLSGHADKFPQELMKIDSERYDDLVLKPVQCPHQTQIYNSQIRSYRDLPIRYMESNKQYRAEQPGELCGLRRVIGITVEDGHSFCRIDQVENEIKIMIEIIKEFFSSLGLWGDHWVSLSVRDPNKPEDYIGDPGDWNTCESMLEKVSNEMDLNAKRCEGEAAVYGPKLDFMFEDALGREIQIPTVQLDFSTPKKFDLSYINKKGEKVPPVMVHRAILGSYERLLVLLIEHFGGAFPVWLSPIQISILPISDKHINYAKEIEKKAQKLNLRVIVDDNNDTIGAKIRNAQIQKIPYMFIVGDREEKSNKVSVRLRTQEELGSKETDKVLEKIAETYKSKNLELW